MTVPTKQVQPNAAHQRRLASIWRVGMVLLAVGLVADTTGQVWNHLGTQGWTLQADALAAAPALLGGLAGLVLTVYAATQFQKGPLPRFAIYGKNQGLDEREITQLMEASAQSQRFFAQAVLVLCMISTAFTRNGLHLSWWSCLLGLIFLLNAVIYLPISLLAAGAKDLEDEK